MSQLSRIAAALEQVVVKMVDNPFVAKAMFDLGSAGRAGMRRIDGARGALVHLLALPSHRDVRKLDAHLARLDVALAEFEAQLRDHRTDGFEHHG
ncbi:MAG: hypothetical protein ACI9JD_000004 [Rhodococcus sp. (in: high G+C Gram-positive bacteria)]|jgi:hypothetical protein